MRKKGESQEREVARQRDPQQLPFDMIADLREEIRKRGRPVTPDALQWEQLPQVSLPWPLLHGCVRHVTHGRHRSYNSGDREVYPRWVHPLFPNQQ